MSRGVSNDCERVSVGHLCEGIIRQNKRNNSFLHDTKET